MIKSQARSAFRAAADLSKADLPLDTKPPAFLLLLLIFTQVCDQNIGRLPGSGTEKELGKSGHTEPLRVLGGRYVLWPLSTVLSS